MQKKFSNRSVDIFFKTLIAIVFLTAGVLYYLVETGIVTEGLFNSLLLAMLALLFSIQTIIGILFNEIAIQSTIIKREDYPKMFVLLLIFFFTVTVFCSVLAVNSLYV